MIRNFLKKLVGISVMILLMNVTVLPLEGVINQDVKSEGKISFQPFFYFIKS